MYKKEILFILLIFFSIGLSAQTPELKCIQVQQNGHVFIEWKKIQTSFQSYDLYYSFFKNGPYTNLISTTDPNQTSYEHTTANALNSRCFYYMKNGATDVSDTLSTIFLHNTQYFDDTVVEITWTPVHEPLPEYLDSNYSIWRKIAYRPWEKIASTDSTIKTDYLKLCSNDTVKYQIRLQHEAGCYSSSRIISFFFNKIYEITPPGIDSVSVDLNTQNAIISWFESPSDDVIFYSVYKKNPGTGYTKLDSIAAPGTFYLYNQSVANTESEIFSLSTLDSCSNNSAIGIVLQNTIFLSKPEYDPCRMKAKLNWTPYENMQGGIKKYVIYISVNNQDFIPVAETLPTEHAYTMENLIENTSYRFFIRAISNEIGRSSSSNIQEIYTLLPQIPADVIQENPTIKNEQVNLNFYVAGDTKHAAYEVRRKAGDNGIFEAVLDVDVTQDSIFSFTDPMADPAANHYWYQILVKDSCNNPRYLSRPLSTICLEIETRGYTNYLTWNNNNDWMGIIDGYEIYRKTDPFEVPVSPLAVVLPGQNQYQDDIQSGFAQGMNISYYLRVLEHRQGKDYEVFSNEVPVDYEQKFFVPNAFTPNGNNPIFKPIGVFDQMESYYFVVISRWGQLLFETDSPQDGWDGNFPDGSPAPQGAYGFKIVLSLKEGNEIIKNGTVLLIR